MGEGQTAWHRNGREILHESGLRDALRRRVQLVFHPVIYFSPSSYVACRVTAIFFTKAGVIT
jgi:hypothetical protein